jgi:hypothetical protein
VAAYPQANTLRWILDWCSRHGLNPYDFYEREFSRTPSAYRLLAAYEGWKAEQEQEEADRARRR